MERESLAPPYVEIQGTENAFIGYLCCVVLTLYTLLVLLIVSGDKA
jgi:hypothetical protein